MILWRLIINFAIKGKWSFIQGEDTGNVYNVYGAACSEVILDVLTGEYQVSRVDILYDCGSR